MALENADRLMRSAKLLADASDFATGCTLLVLSAEEILKAMMWMGKSMGFPMSLKAQRQFSTDHRTRHNVGMMNVLIAYPFGRYVEWMFSLQSRFGDDIEALRSARQSEFKDYLQFITNLPRDPDFVGTLEWWEKANELKNAGLYVDYIDGSWRTPSSIGAQTFEDALSIVSSLKQTLGDGLVEWTKSEASERKATAKSLRAHLRASFPRDDE